MRQLFLSQYKHRSNPILLTYQNNYHRFTFLQNDFGLILAKNNKVDNSNRIKSTQIGNFLQQLGKYKQNVLKVQQYDFREGDLDRILKIDFANGLNKGDKKIDASQNAQPQLIWKHNEPLIQKLSQNFQQMTTNLSNTLTKSTLHQSILTLTQFNCLQIKIWQKLISFSSHYYKSSPLKQRLTLITALSEYMKKFQFSFLSKSQNINNKKPAFKFMYPQSYIIDLVDFRELFKSLECEDDFIKQSDTLQQQTIKLMILQNFIYLIMKATKKADMNIYTVKEYFSKRAKEMIGIAQRHKESELHSRVMYNIYFIYSYLNYSDGEFYSEIEKCYYDMLRQKMMKAKKFSQSSDKQQKQSYIANIDHKQIHMQSKQVNKLLSIWKLNQRANINIYNEMIKPFLFKMLQNGLQKKYYSNIAINLLTSGITDTIVFDKMIETCEKQGIKDDQFMHMLKHFLNVKGKKLSYGTNYHKCQGYQNPKILNYLNKNHIEVYSQCLMSGNGNKDLKSDKNKKFINNKSSQHHRTQRIWSDIVKSLFQPKYEVIENANICNYEIDFLILTNKKMYAIEIQGGHYNKKEFNSSTNDKTQKDSQNSSQNKIVKSTGKRQIRQMILKAYNIQFVKIHCQEKLPTYIMQSRNIPAGKKYIAEKIFIQTGVKLEDI